MELSCDFLLRVARNETSVLRVPLHDLGLHSPELDILANNICIIPKTNAFVVSTS
jgi:hypothetical protein